MTRWYRRYVGTVSDPKIAEVALVAECSRSVVVAAWDMILESAAEVNDSGRFRATSRNVAATLGESCATVERVFAALGAIGMVADGVVLAWSKRQFCSDSSTERSRRHRDAKKKTEQIQSGSSPQQDATLQGRCATVPDTDSETDTETEKKKEESTRPSESDAAREEMVAAAPESGTDGRTPAFADLKARFNGITETMLAFIEAQMGAGSRPNAEQWLSSTVAAHGHEAVAQAFAAIVEKRAAGEISARPLPHWSSLAAGMKRGQKPRAPPARGPRPDGQVGVAELLKRRREAEASEVKS